MRCVGVCCCVGVVCCVVCCGEATPTPLTVSGDKHIAHSGASTPLCGCVGESAMLCGCVLCVRVCVCVCVCVCVGLCVCVLSVSSANTTPTHRRV